MIFLFLQCVSTVIIVYNIISPLNSYLYIHGILDLKQLLLLVKTCTVPPRGTSWILGALRLHAKLCGISEQVGAPEIQCGIPIGMWLRSGTY